MGTDKLPTHEGLRQLERAVGRLVKETPPHPHPFFGALTREEWIKLQLRHAELHLGYLHPEGP